MQNTYTIGGSTYIVNFQKEEHVHDIYADLHKLHGRLSLADQEAFRTLTFNIDAQGVITLSKINKGGIVLYPHNWGLSLLLAKGVIVENHAVHPVIIFDLPETVILRATVPKQKDLDFWEQGFHDYGYQAHVAKMMEGELKSIAKKLFTWQQQIKEVLHANLTIGDVNEPVQLTMRKSVELNWDRPETSLIELWEEVFEFTVGPVKRGKVHFDSERDGLTLPYNGTIIQTVIDYMNHPKPRGTVVEAVKPAAASVVKPDVKPDVKRIVTISKLIVSLSKLRSSQGKNDDLDAVLDQTIVELKKLM